MDRLFGLMGVHNGAPRGHDHLEDETTGERLGHSTEQPGFHTPAVDPSEGIRQVSVAEGDGTLGLIGEAWDLGVEDQAEVVRPNELDHVSTERSELLVGSERIGGGVDHLLDEIGQGLLHDFNQEILGAGEVLVERGSPDSGGSSNIGMRSVLKPLFGE